MKKNNKSNQELSDFCTLVFEVAQLKKKLLDGFS